MNISTNKHIAMTLTEVFNPIMLKTADGHTIAVAMRDDTFEITVMVPDGGNVTHRLNTVTHKFEQLGDTPVAALDDDTPIGDTGSPFYEGELIAVERDTTGVTVKEAWEVLRRAMSKDFDWAWSVHSALAMPVMDSTDVSHVRANIAAASLMNTMFDYDVTGLKRYLDIVQPVERELPQDSSLDDPSC